MSSKIHPSIHFIIALLLQTGDYGCGERSIYHSEVEEYRTTFSDKAILAATYSNYLVPKGFCKYVKHDRESIVYVRLFDKVKGYIERCSEDQNEAKALERAADSASSTHRSLIGQRETDKYFEFVTESYYPRINRRDTLLMRVHKCSYLDRSDFEESKRPSQREFTGWYQGTFNLRPITGAAVRNLGEYLWFHDHYQGYGSKVLSSFTQTFRTEICHTMYTTESVVYDDLGSVMPDPNTIPTRGRERQDVTLIRLDYHIDKDTGRITLDSHDIRTIKLIDNPPEVRSE